MNMSKNSKIHLLVFMYSMGDGGAERVTANLTNHWALRGWDITLLTIAPIKGDLFDLHPTIERISLDLAAESSNKLLGLWQNIGRIKALRKVLKQLRPDIALSMMTTSNILLALASFGLASIKTIGAERTTPLRPSVSFIWSVLRKYTYGLLGAVVSMSEDGRNWFQKNTYAKKVLAMPNPVTWPLPLLEPQLYPPRFQPRILLGVGRLIEEKGFELLFEVFIELKDKYPEWGLAIVGDGPLRSFLEQRIKQSGLQNRVFLPGRAGNIGKWYESADIFALSSLYEGFPNVLVEAMAYGLPVVSFDCNSGPRDIIRHEIDGLLVPQGSKSDLTKALDRLMSDDVLRKKYSERALEVRERFSMENISEMWDRLFDELLNKN